jgi:hypothetical protein
MKIYSTFGLLIVLITSCSSDKIKNQEIESVLSEVMMRNDALVNEKLKSEYKFYKRDLTTKKHLKEFHTRIVTFINHSIDTIDQENLETMTIDFINNNYVEYYDNDTINLNIPKGTPRILIKLQMANFEYAILRGDAFLELTPIHFHKPIIITDKDIYNRREKVTGEIIIAIGPSINEYLNSEIELNGKRIMIKDKKARFSISADSLNIKGFNLLGLEAKVKIADSTYSTDRTIIIK